MSENTISDSRPQVAGRPNVVVVLLDDVGFGQLGCFGSDIRTPTMDRLAAEGLRYNRFHVTALCSPSRASLLTGRNHHAVGMGFLVDMPTLHRGYSCRIPTSAATLPRVLRDAGWSTMAVGKWHLVPRNDRTAAGPFDSWTLGMGFERYYGFLHGDANQWTPTLVRDNSPVEQPRSPEEGYHLTEDLVDESLRMVRDQQASADGKPFFLYLAPGTAHAPHQVPQEWADEYAGVFDDGWEAVRQRTFDRQRELGVVPEGAVLPERPPWIAEWAALSPKEQRLYARFQEVFAGFLTHFDHHLGRLIAGLEEQGVLDNTLILLTSDNGASAEGGTVGSVNEHRFGFGMADSLEENLAAHDDLGGFRTYNHYPWGWAWAGNAPFKLWKRYTWLGGTRTPLIVRPPSTSGAERGAVREQLCHISDVFSTVLEVCGVEAPTVVDGHEQQPIDGRSLVPSFAAPTDVPRTQYFEMLGSRSIIHDGWKATTDHISSGVLDERLLIGSRDFETDHWSLYDLAADFSEANDLSAEHPDKLAELQAVWEQEAERNHVLPMFDGLHQRLAFMEPAQYPIPNPLVLRPGGNPLADEAVPSLALGLAVEADVDVTTAPEGVLAAMGDWHSGWCLAVQDGLPVFFVNTAAAAFTIRADEQLPEGRHRVGFHLKRGEGVLTVDDREVGRGPLPLGMGASGLPSGGGGLRRGHDAGCPGDDAYTPPFRWNGVLHTVTFRDPSPAAPTVEELLKRE